MDPPVTHAAAFTQDDKGSDTSSGDTGPVDVAVKIQTGRNEITIGPALRESANAKEGKKEINQTK